MLADLKDPIYRLRVIAFFEGCSFIFLLFVSMPLKYYMDMKDFSFNVGLIHGYLFVTYVIFALETLIRRRIGFLEFLKVFVASIIPFGTFYNDKMLINKQREYVGI